jgi:hypothetical protein
MKLLIDNIEIEFNQFVDHQTNHVRNEWVTSIEIDKSKHQITFSEEIFRDYKSGEITINWDFIKLVVKEFKEHVESLILQSTKVLISLHQQIFGNEYHEREGYFDFDGMEIIRYNSDKYLPNSFCYRIELGFALESNQNFVMDYLSYSSIFDRNQINTFTIVGVNRE